MNNEIYYSPEYFVRQELTQGKLKFDGKRFTKFLTAINDSFAPDTTILKEIIYWHLLNEKGEIRLKEDKDLYQHTRGCVWLARQNDDWIQSCGINKHQSRRSLARLVKRGLIFKAAPLIWATGKTRVHVRLNWEKLAQLLWEKLNPSAKNREKAKSKSAKNKTAQKPCTASVSSEKIATPNAQSPVDKIPEREKLKTEKIDFFANPRKSLSEGVSSDENFSSRAIPNGEIQKSEARSKKPEILHSCNSVCVGEANLLFLGSDLDRQDLNFDEEVESATKDFESEPREREGLILKHTQSSKTTNSVDLRPEEKIVVVDGSCMQRSDHSFSGQIKRPDFSDALDRAIGRQKNSDSSPPKAPPKTPQIRSPRKKPYKARELEYDRHGVIRPVGKGKRVQWAVLRAMQHKIWQAWCEESEEFEITLDADGEVWMRDPLRDWTTEEEILGSFPLTMMLDVGGSCPAYPRIKVEEVNAFGEALYDRLEWNSPLLDRLNSEPFPEVLGFELPDLEWEDALEAC